VNADKPTDAEPRLLIDALHRRLVIWWHAQTSVQLRSFADGSDIGAIGGRERDGAEVHHLEPTELDALQADIDGTFLGRFWNRLMRFDAHGDANVSPTRITEFQQAAEKASTPEQIETLEQEFRK
jgi:hypothetical protein